MQKLCIFIPSICTIGNLYTPRNFPKVCRKVLEMPILSHSLKLKDYLE